DVVMEIPPETFKFEKVKGKLHAEVNILGIAYKADGSTGAKFSDAVKLDMENKKELDVFEQKAFHYENQLEIASGQYNFKVVFSAVGETFGKWEQKLVIAHYDAKQFGLSAIALSHELHKASEAD